MNQIILGFKDQAEAALNNGALVAIVKSETIRAFERLQHAGSYHVHMVRQYHLYDETKPAEHLFTLNVPYLLEIGIEDDLETIQQQPNITEYNRNVLEVESGIELLSNTGEKIEIISDWTKGNNVIDWNNEAFYAQIFHDSIFTDEDTPSSYSPFMIKIGPHINATQQLHKLEFEDAIQLDLSQVAQDYLTNQ